MPDLKKLIKFTIVAIEAHDDDKNCSSKYTSKSQILQRLSECQQSWHTYFETPQDEELKSDSFEEEGSEECS